MAQANLSNVSMFFVLDQGARNIDQRGEGTQWKTWDEKRCGVQMLLQFAFAPSGDLILSSRDWLIKAESSSLIIVVVPRCGPCHALASCRHGNLLSVLPGTLSKGDQDLL